MAEAADFSMPNAFAKDYLDKIIKKTGKCLNNTCILYTGRKTKSGFQRIQYCVFVDLFQIQCLQRSHHQK